MSKHYTAVLEVQETTNLPETKEYTKIIPASRTTAEVARIVVRADTLESLQKKLSAHVALIEN